VRNGGELLLRLRHGRSTERPAVNDATGHAYQPGHPTPA